MATLLPRLPSRAARPLAPALQAPARPAAAASSRTSPPLGGCRRSATALGGGAAAALLRRRRRRGLRAVETEVEAETRFEKKARVRILEEAEGGGIRGLAVTTPLFYANGPPHIGSAYPTITADVLARYARMRGAELHFTTGMDEHGEKIAQTAKGKDQTPQELVDEIAGRFQGLWEKLSVEPDHFVRTTAKSHRAVVEEMWKRCEEKGDIYKKNYEGYYCVGCEAYLDDDEMEGPDHVCKIHRKPCELRQEENYFFRLSNYWEDVRKHLEENPNFILPVKRTNEVLYWLRDDNKRDFSISRASTSWGIPVPGDESQVIYVWFDALLGYLSSLLGPDDEASLTKAESLGWPADVHVIGKDIMRFHAIYWPAMLMSAGLALPKHICTHGFLTKDGLKMGKSLGNVVEPLELVEAFGADAVRFFFAGCLSFGEDVDFSYKTFILKVNAPLANTLGNLVHRLLTLCRKNLGEEPKTALDLLEEGEDEAALEAHPVVVESKGVPQKVAGHYEAMDFTKAAIAAMELAEVGNRRMMEVEPWKLLKEGEDGKRRALREMLLMAEAVRMCAVCLFPFTPDLSRKIMGELGLPAPGAAGPSWAEAQWRWEPLPGLCKGKKPKPVFQRIDVEAWEGK